MLKSVGFGTTASTFNVTAMVASFAQGRAVCKIVGAWRANSAMRVRSLSVGAMYPAIDAVGNDGADGLGGQSQQRLVVRGV